MEPSATSSAATAEKGVADDLASLLASGERAAFHGRPGAGVDPLERAAAVATERNLPTETAAARWLLAVCQSAAGRFGQALRALDELAAGLGRGPVGAPVVLGPSLSHLAASRQLPGAMKPVTTTKNAALMLSAATSGLIALG